MGTIRSRTQNPRDDAEAKANSTITSYHQLAHSMFRHSRKSLHLREQLAKSLRHDHADDDEEEHHDRRWRKQEEPKQKGGEGMMDGGCAVVGKKTRTGHDERNRKGKAAFSYQAHKTHVQEVP